MRYEIGQAGDTKLRGPCDELLPEGVIFTGLSPAPIHIDIDLEASHTQDQQGQPTQDAEDMARQPDEITGVQILQYPVKRHFQFGGRQDSSGIEIDADRGSEPVNRSHRRHRARSRQMIFDPFDRNVLMIPHRFDDGCRYFVQSGLIGHLAGRPQSLPNGARRIAAAQKKIQLQRDAGGGDKDEECPGNDRQPAMTGP